eukprot:5384191-Pleurochrysis_carterae.AAC.3
MARVMRRCIASSRSIGRLVARTHRPSCRSSSVSTVFTFDEGRETRANEDTAQAVGRCAWGAIGGRDHGRQRETGGEQSESLHLFIRTQGEKKENEGVEKAERS